MVPFGDAHVVGFCIVCDGVFVPLLLELEELVSLVRVTLLKYINEDRHYINTITISLYLSVMNVYIVSILFIPVKIYMDGSGMKRPL